MTDFYFGVDIMKCTKCRKVIPDDSKFCNHCGAKQENQKMYRRPDGLYEKLITISPGKRKAFRGKTPKEVLQKIADYNIKETAGPLFSELVEAWENDYCQKLTPSTVHGYQASKKASLEFFGGVHIKDIQTYDIQQFIESLPDSFSKNTVGNYLATLSSIFSYAVRSRDFPIKINPCHQAKIRGQAAQERRLATDEELDIILNNTDKPFGLFPLFILFTGCRRAEALALEWSDIDFENDLIRINKALTWVDFRPVIKPPKTKKSIRNILLLPELKKILPKNKSGLIFPNTQGNYMSESSYEKAWDRYYRLSGLKEHNENHNQTKLTAHCLRHGYATILYEANVDVKEAQRLLGHSKEATTRDIYTHITERSQNKNAKKLKLYVNKHFGKNNKDKKSS